jgi:hypothetical protein
MDKDKLLKEKRGIGVIVCRMQVPYLTDSHHSVVNTVLNRHERIIMFLGTTNKPVDFKNPYPFEFRKQMIEKEFPDVKHLTIIPLPDNEDNALWVKILDSLILSFLSKEESAVLYGGRDSFIPYYKKDAGRFDCVELSPNDYDSGTQLRELSAIKLPEYTVESAQAILWALNQKL